MAAVWFGPSQVSSACSLGVFGNQLGVALGFLIPPMLVKNHDDLDLVGADLKFMFYSVAGFSSVLLVFIILCGFFNISWHTDKRITNLNILFFFLVLQIYSL